MKQREEGKNTMDEEGEEKEILFGRQVYSLIWDMPWWIKKGIWEELMPPLRIQGGSRT